MNWKPFAAALLAIMTWMPVQASDPFYQARLKEGLTALQAQHPVDAVDQLRIAAFGMLDTPKDLSESLALLAIAQNALDRSDDVTATMNRFLEVERRFASYDPATLGDFRPQFEALLVRSVPKPTLAGVPSLARLVMPAGANNRATTTITASASQNAPVVPASRPPATTSAQTTSSPVATAPPRTTTPASSATPQRSPAQTSSAAQRTPPETSSASAQTAAPKPAAPAKPADGTAAINKAMQLLRERRAAEAVDLLTLAVSKEPARRDLHLTLLQAAAMSSNWPVALAQLSILKPLQTTETIAMFYAAVALYESGKLPEAREYLNRALPKIAPSPYVDYYAKKISGKS